MLKNGVNSLKLLDAFDCLGRAGAVRQNEGVCCLAGGVDSGAEIARIGEEGFSYKVHRAQLLSELLRDVPAERMHVLKKLVRVDETEGCLRLWFEDGSSHECDILVGADGVWSTVRKVVLGDDHPAVTAVYAGWSTLWQLQPVELMKRDVGAQYFDLANPYQYYWLGQGAYIQHDLLSNGELCTCIAAYETGQIWTGERWGKVVDREEVRKAYIDFPDHLKHGMIEVSRSGRFREPLLNLCHSSCLQMMHRQFSPCGNIPMLRHTVEDVSAYSVMLLMPQHLGWEVVEE